MSQDPKSNPPADAARNVEAPGPFTPLETPLDTGNESGGDYQFKHSTPTPQTKENN